MGNRVFMVVLVATAIAVLSWMIVWATDRAVVTEEERQEQWHKDFCKQYLRGNC